MTQDRVEGVGFRLGIVSVLTALLPTLLFGALLRELEPIGIGAGFSAARMLVQALIIAGLGVALGNLILSGPLAAIERPEGPALDALAASHRLPTLFTAGCFGVWMIVAWVALAIEPESGGASVAAMERWLAFTAIGAIAAAANLSLSARTVAPLSAVLAQRIDPEEREHVGRPLPLTWTLRVAVFALVVSPALLGGVLDRARVLRAGLDGFIAPASAAETVLLPLALLAAGLLLVEGVGSALRRTSSALRDSALGTSEGAAELAESEFSEASDALARLAEAAQRVAGAFETVAQDLGEGLADLDATRSTVSEKTDAQVSDVQRLTESVSSVYSHSENIETAIGELRSAVDESSSAVTELGAAGEQLVGTAGELLSSAETASTSIQGVLTSVGEIASSTDVLAGVAGEASASMEEMAASMREVNESAERCSHLSDQVVQVADDGSRVVQQTIDGMQAIRDATGTAESVIRGLGDRAGEIGAIVDVIDGVANETSLLALNAAIIAAQAGEHGRGFSVVATEIRELATRVSSSTKEITNLIRSVQDESANAIGAIERGAQSVASGVDLSEQAGRSLIEITRVARSNKKLVEGIVHSVAEQTKAAGHVVGVIEEVNSQADRIRAAARNQQNGNDAVLEQAIAMKEMAQQVHHTADEQSRGTRVIVQTVESIVTGLDKIGASVKQQTESCQTVVASTWDAYRRAKETNESARGLESVAGSLRAAIESARSIVTVLKRG